MPINSKFGYGDDEDLGAPAVLPKSVLMGKRVNVGDTVTLRVDRIMEDQIAVSYAPSKPKPEPEPTPDETPPEQSETQPEQEPESSFGYD